MANITINNKNTSFKDNANVIGVINEGVKPEPHNDAATVQELRKIQDELKEMSGICDELQKALQKNDKSKIYDIVGKFGEGAFGVIGEVVVSQIINKIFKP